MKQNDPFFQMKNVSISFGSHQILNDVSFSMEKGILTGLLGANGSGKTTLLRAICNQLPHSGQCILQQSILERLSTRELAKNITYIPQRSGIHISMSALDVVLTGYNPVLKLTQSPTNEMKNAAVNALSHMGLGASITRDYLTLSEGEKQLCILARALIEDTSLLLLDEPDSSLDFHNKYSMMNVLSQLITQYHKTGILCLHDPMLALNYCDQLLLLKNGRICAILHPKTDSIGSMESALADIYGPVQLSTVKNADNKPHLALLSAIR